MSKKVRNIVLVAVGILAVVGAIAMMLKKTKNVTATQS